MFSIITAPVVVAFFVGMAFSLICASLSVLCWLWLQGGKQPQFHQVMFGTSDQDQRPQRVN